MWESWSEQNKWDAPSCKLHPTTTWTLCVLVVNVRFKYSWVRHVSNSWMIWNTYMSLHFWNMSISFFNNRMVTKRLAPETFKVGSRVWDWLVRSIQDPWYARLRTGWPLEARRSLFPDWPWLCDESSPVTTQKGSAHSCSNFGGKIQNGVPANS